MTDLTGPPLPVCIETEAVSDILDAYRPVEILGESRGLAWFLASVFFPSCLGFAAHFDDVPVATGKDGAKVEYSEIPGVTLGLIAHKGLDGQVSIVRALLSYS